MEANLATWSAWLGIGALLVGFAVTVPPTPSAAQNDGCSALTDAQRAAMAEVQLTTPIARTIDRYQVRPWVRFPLGVAIRVRAPEGTDLAVVKYAARCGLLGPEHSSPLGVPGARLKVRQLRTGYELYVTAWNREIAEQIQSRAALQNWL